MHVEHNLSDICYNSLEKINKIEKRIVLFYFLFVSINSWTTDLKKNGGKKVALCLGYYHYSLFFHARQASSNCMKQTRRSPCHTGKIDQLF